MYDDLDKHIQKLWNMVAVAARYGHQQMSEIRACSVEELHLFNDALGHLIEAENRSGNGHTNKFAQGGG